MIFSERLVHGDGGGDILNRHDSFDFTWHNITRGV